MVGVVMLSVLLMLTMPPQPDSYQPVQDEVAPSSDAQPERRIEYKRLKELSSELPAGSEEKREVPAAPKARFEFYDTLRELELDVPVEVVVPEDEGIRFKELKKLEEPGKQLQAPATEKPAGTAVAVPPATYYLQVGSFRERDRAIGLKEELSGMGFRCEIHMVSINNKDVYHRVRVGPFAGPEALDEARRKLAELHIESQTVGHRE